MNFRLLYPDWLWAFIPLLFFVSFLVWKRYFRAPWFSLRRSLLITFALASLVFALARPQWGTTDSTKKAVSPSIILAIDISRSMLVEDVLPNRLAYAGLFSQRLLEALSQPRVSVFPFAASGFLLVPFTTDLFAIEESLNGLDPTATSHQGTNFNQLLKDIFLLIEKQKQELSQSIEGYQNPVVLILSDGESHSDFDASVLKHFVQSDIKIFSVAIGTPEGGIVPGERTQSVRSRFQAEPLRTISLKTGGGFFIGDLTEIAPLAQQINRNVQLTQTKSQFKATHELFTFFVFLSVILFLFDFVLSQWQYVIRLSLLFFCLSLPALAETSEGKKSAVEIYNQGLIELKEENPEKAAEFFEESSLLLQDPQGKKQALFNLGNAFLKMGDPEQAIESYQKAYRIKSSSDTFEQEANQRISDNIALAAKVLKQMKSEDQQSGAEEEGKGDSKEGKDPKGPQKFKGAELSEDQKKKLFDLIASEERETQRRLREKNRPRTSPEGKTW